MGTPFLKVGVYYRLAVQDRTIYPALSGNPADASSEHRTRPENCSCVCPVEEASFTDGFALGTPAIHGGYIRAEDNPVIIQALNIQNLSSPPCP
jgi:hypothetical protein